MRFELVAALGLSLSLVGCGLGPAAPSSAVPTTASIQGTLHGGQQPISGAHIYVFAAGTNGYSQPSVSRVWQYSGHQDASGGATNGDYYVLTDSTGSFGLQSEYTCDHSDDLLYIYAQGGDAGAGPNSAIGGLAILGTCANPAPYVSINEVTTVAAAYAMAGFAVDATHVSSSGTALAKVGITNAFANAGNLANIATGAALTTTPAGNGTVPQATINTLADILAACINSAGPSSTGCTTLLSNALSGGTTGTQPTDTATAAINIAHNPTANIAALYGNPTPISPFVPTLGAQPNDLTLGIQYTGGGLTSPSSIAIDASGNAFINAQSGIIKLSSLGVLAPNTPFIGLQGYGHVAIDSAGNAWTSSPLNATVNRVTNAGAPTASGSSVVSPSYIHPLALAIDGSDNGWVIDPTGENVTKISSSGSILSPVPNGYTNAAMIADTAIAIDGNNAVWITPSVSGVVVLSNSGSFVGTYDLSLHSLQAICFDSGNNAWVSSTSGIWKLSNTGTLLSPSGGYGLSGYNLAVDGGGNIWTANEGNNVGELSNSGTILSGTTGFMGGVVMKYTAAIAIDGSGDAWVTSESNNSVVELIGAATPVITPISAGVARNALGTRP